MNPRMGSRRACRMNSLASPGASTVTSSAHMLSARTESELWLGGTIYRQGVGPEAFVWYWTGASWRGHLVDGLRVPAVDSWSTTLGWASVETPPVKKLYYRDGEEWALGGSIPTGGAPVSLRIFSPTEAYAGTDQGEILRWDGSVWQVEFDVETVPGGALTFVDFMRSPDGTQILAVAAPETILVRPAGVYVPTVTPTLGADEAEEPTPGETTGTPESSPTPTNTADGPTSTTPETPDTAATPETPATPGSATPTSTIESGTTATVTERADLLTPTGTPTGTLPNNRLYLPTLSSPGFRR
jgi:hypothetical protein